MVREQTAAASCLMAFPWLSACLLLSELQAGSGSAAAVCDGLKQEFAVVRVRGDQSDAFQYKKTGVTYSGSSGEIYLGRSAYHGNVVSALRFSDVQVPKGARIAAARVRLVDAHAGTVCCKGSDLMVLLRLERAADSTPLPRHHTPGWLLSLLPMTSAKTWLPPATDTYNATLTPDFGDMVQSVVDIEGWNAGNAITVLLDGEGEKTDIDERVYFGSAVSFPTHRATLEIDFCRPPASTAPPPMITPVCPPTPRCERCVPSTLPATSADGVVVMADTAPAAADTSTFSASSVTMLVIAMMALGVTAVLAAGTMRRRRDRTDEEDIERFLGSRFDDQIE